MAEIKFSLPLSAFSYWDEAGQRAYQPGTYSILVAGTSPVRKMKALGLDDPLEVKVKLTADKRIVKY